MPWAVAAVTAAGSLAGGVLSSNAAQSASAQEVAQQEQALAFEKGVYGTAQTNLNPYINTGTNALYSLANLYGLPGASGGASGNGALQAYQNYTQTPAYTFALQQGDLGANRALAASGLSGSGAQAKGISQYNQGLASQNFGGYVNQLASLAGLGQNSAVSLGNIGNQNAQLQSSTYGSIGAAQAAGTLGSANALNQGIQNATGVLYGQNVLNSLSGQGGSSYGQPDWAGAGTEPDAAANSAWNGP